ncbi:MAG: hypothetical protein M5U28_45490 [Sandaracinaceae bacterium]|nr:hypothetical protein [Sandaracinaceae bacterium]
MLENRVTPFEQLRPDLPPALGDVIRRAMAPDPQSRLQGSEALADAYAAAIGSPSRRSALASSAGTPPAPQRPRRMSAGPSLVASKGSTLAFDVSALEKLPDLSEAAPMFGAAHGSAAHGSAAHGSAAHGSAAHGSAAYGSAAHGSAAHGSAGHGSVGHASAGHGSVSLPAGPAASDYGAGGDTSPLGGAAAYAPHASPQPAAPAPSPAPAVQAKGGDTLFIPSMTGAPGLDAPGPPARHGAPLVAASQPSPSMASWAGTSAVQPQVPVQPHTPTPGSFSSKEAVAPPPKKKSRGLLLFFLAMIVVIVFSAAAGFGLKAYQRGDLELPFLTRE